MLKPVIQDSISLIIVTTPTQPQHNSKVGFDTKRTLHTHHTNSMSAISQLLLTKFQPTVSRTNIQEMITVTVTFVQETQTKSI